MHFFQEARCEGATGKHWNADGVHLGKGHGVPSLCKCSTHFTPTQLNIQMQWCCTDAVLQNIAPFKENGVDHVESMSVIPKKGSGEIWQTIQNAGYRNVLFTQCLRRRRGMMRIDSHWLNITGSRKQSKGRNSLLFNDSIASRPFWTIVKKHYAKVARKAQKRNNCRHSYLEMP